MSAEDKLAVAECLYRYALGVDTRDWVLYRSSFADDVELDFSSYSPGRSPATMAADDWVAGVRPQFDGLAASQHLMSNPLVALDGDEAQITMYVRAHHVFDPADPQSFYTVGGIYRNRLVRGIGDWRLTRVELDITWRVGRPEIMDAARAAGLSPIRAAPPRGNDQPDVDELSRRCRHVASSQPARA